MPEMNTKFSRGMPSVGMTFWTVARMAKSPQPGHQRTIWSDLKSLAWSMGPEAGRCWSSSSWMSAMSVSSLQQRFDAGFHLGDLERLALDLVEAGGGDEVLRAENLEQLAHVELGHEDVLEARHDVAQVGRERDQVAQVHRRDALALLLQALHAVLYGAVRAAPALDEDLALLLSQDLRRRDVLRDLVNQHSSQAH